MQNGAYIDYVAWAGVALGFLSLVWNVVSFFVMFSKTRVNLKFTVTYKLQIEELGLMPNNVRLTWNIANLSPFTVYIDAIGFCSHKHIFFGKNVFYEIPYIYIKNSYNKEQNLLFPFQLDSRKAVIFYLYDGNQLEEARTHRYMYISTSCGYFSIKNYPFPLKIFNHPRKEYR